MATKTSLLGLTKPAYTDAADIAVLNTNFDMIDKAVGNGMRAENILDNSDFSAARFIAAAGLNGLHDAVVYLGDRWRGHANITATQQGSGVLLNASAATAYIMQRVHVKAGQVYTLAFYATGRSGTHRMVAYNSGVTTIVAYDQAADRDLLVVNFTATEDTMAMLYYPGYATNGGSGLLHWAALYEGAYTADTLPAYVYKGYAAELLACQRYFMKVAAQPVNGWCYNWGRVTVFVPLPVTMRSAAPVVKLTAASSNYYIGSTSYPSTLKGCNATGNGVAVYFEHSNSGSGQCVMPEFAADFIDDL